MNTDPVISYLHNSRPQFVDGLKRLLRIPSISSIESHRASVAQAGMFVAEALLGLGLENVQLVPGRAKEHPLVRGEWMNAPGKPTLALYAHYDVQPVDPMALWTTMPFDPTIRDGNIYARGAADDKGQLWLLIAVLEAFMRSEGKLPINVKVLFEGEEESSGTHIARFVHDNAGGWLSDVDAVLVLDNGMFAPGLPTISGGLRGIICAEVIVRGAKRDLHSGQYGGAAPNAAIALSKIIAALHTPTGRVRIPGFYKDVIKPSKLELDSWASLPFDAEDYRRNELGAQALIGDKRYSVQHRLWALPTVEVNGQSSGFTGDGFKTVIPGEARAKMSLRLVPGMGPQTTAEAFVRFIRSVTPNYATSEVQILSTDAAVRLDLENQPIQALAAAYEETFGRKTAFVRSGGSIPIAATFQSSLGKPIAVTGFTLNCCNEHAPNEYMPLDHLYQGSEAMVRWFRKLGR